MIDQERLLDAYERDAFYALQLEVGDRCEQGCVYCYMNGVPEGSNTLSDEQIRNVLAQASEAGFTAVEWLGGEPLLRESIFEHMGFAAGLGFRNNLWTGGLPLTHPRVAARCVEYTTPGLISVHVSTVDPEVYARLHPNRPERDLEDILSGVRLVLSLGYPPERMLNSMTLTGWQTAEDAIRTIDFFEQEFGIQTSLNVYHTYLRPGAEPGELASFIPDEAEVDRVYEHWMQQAGDGPLPMNCVDKFYCSTTVAVLCDGSVTPCATVREPDAPTVHDSQAFASILERHREHLIFKPFKNEANLPDSCQRCFLSDRCWGCRSRAYAAGRGLYGKDPRCFRFPSDPEGGTRTAAHRL
jgi:radical SAM protein with 4Fe4S-binding SPASM domain